MSKINISDLLSTSIDYQKSEIQALNPEEQRKIMGGGTQIFDDGTTLTTEYWCDSKGRSRSYIRATDTDGSVFEQTSTNGYCA
jgi:hypothetical protein